MLNLTITQNRLHTDSNDTVFDVHGNNFDQTIWSMIGLIDFLMQVCQSYTDRGHLVVLKIRDIKRDEERYITKVIRCKFGLKVQFV